MFRVGGAMKQILRATKPFWARGADVPKQWSVIDFLTTRRTALLTGDRQMRTLSFILAFAFILSGPFMAGPVDGSLPGVGAFSYNGSPLNSVPQAIIVAAR